MLGSILSLKMGQELNVQMAHQQLRKDATLHKTATLIFALLPIIKNYGTRTFDFGFVCTIILFLFLILKPSISKDRIPQYLSLYLGYYLLIWLVCALYVGDSIIPLGWLRIAIVFYTFFSTVKIRLLLRYYTIVCYACMAFLAVQNVVYFSSGIKLPGIAEFLPLALGLEDDRAYYESITSEAWRMCSFFSEPAEFAQYLMPFLAITLFKKNVNKRLIKIAVIVSSYLLLQSGNAMLVLAVVFLCYIISLIFTTPSFTKFLGLIALALTIFIGGGYFLSTEMGEQLMARQDETSGKIEGSYASSGFFRIYRGFYVYDELSGFEKTFGANNKGLMDQAINKSPIRFLFDKDDYYFNTFQNIIIKTGIVGCIIFIMFLISVYRRTTPYGKTIIISMAALSFIAAFYLSYIMLLYLVIASKSLKTQQLIDENCWNNHYSCRS